MIGQRLGATRGRSTVIGQLLGAPGGRSQRAGLTDLVPGRQVLVLLARVALLPVQEQEVDHLLLVVPAHEEREDLVKGVCLQFRSTPGLRSRSTPSLGSRSTTGSPFTQRREKPCSLPDV